LVSFITTEDDPQHAT